MRAALKGRPFFWYDGGGKSPHINRCAMKIKTGKGEISFGLMIAIWSVSAIASLPGLAVSPILGDMNKIFPTASDLEIQMLTSLPSLLIIPFVLLSGSLSVGRNKLHILYAGLAVFFVSGVACLFARSMLSLIVISCILGIGAGMVIPLSTGLVADYFTGDYRVRQLGYSSAINNLTLVAATAATGYLADVSWHLPFLVYLLPGVSLVLSLSLRNHPAADEPKESDQMRNTRIDAGKLAGVTVFYFLMTCAVLAIAFDTSFLVDKYGFPQSLSGVIISVFFLAIMLPGMFLGNVIKVLKSYVNIISAAAVATGLLCVGLFHNIPMIFFGTVLAGLGYGIVQPIIYDKAAIVAPPGLATRALSVVMTANYLAIMVYPFLMDGLRKVFHTQSILFTFYVNAVVAALIVAAAFVWRRSFALGLDKSYYPSKR